MTRLAVIVNEAARGPAGALAAEVVAAGLGTGTDVDLLLTRHRGDAVDQAQRAAADGRVTAVVAVGGDGTAREVAEGMARGLRTWPAGGPALAGAPLLVVLPGGTGNTVRDALHGDAFAGDAPAWQGLLAAVAEGTASRADVDLIRIVEHDVAVLLGASTGFFRWTVEATSRFPELSGRDRYMAAGLAVAEQLTPYRGSVEVDGVPLASGDLALVAVGGTAHRSGTVAVLPRSRLDDGLLDVCVLKATGAADFVPLMARVLDGSHLGQPGVAYARGRRVALRSLDGPLPLEHDGDPWPGDDASLTLEVVPAALPVARAPA